MTYACSAKTHCENKSVFSYLRTLTTLHCPHSPTTAAVSPAHQANSSKPAAAADRAHAETDGHCTIPQTLLCIVCGHWAVPIIHDT